MDRVLIPKSRIPEFLESLKLHYRVVAPVKNSEVLEFNEFESADQVLLTDEITYKSPKEFLFPQVEKFLYFDEKGELHAEHHAVKTVIFGVRPCDLEALKVLAAVFTKGNFEDPLFVNHLKNTVLIGMGCINEKPGCFCGERGVDKNGSRECDLFLRDMGDYYIADVVTEKGCLIIKEFLPDVEYAGEVDGNASAAAAEREILELEADEKTLFNNIDWNRISETCISCGTCTYICPTCHCFEFRDVAEKGTASRYRCWDSCMYPRFTIHASGHNPRATKKERYRQRVMHKYLYVKQNFGYTACTGCGRCVRSCPAGISIRSVVIRIMEELT